MTAHTIEIQQPSNNSAFVVDELIGDAWIERYRCTATGSAYRGSWSTGDRGRVHSTGINGRTVTEFTVDEYGGIVWDLG